MEAAKILQTMRGGGSEFGEGEEAREWNVPYVGRECGYKLFTKLYVSFTFFFSRLGFLYRLDQIKLF